MKNLLLKARFRLFKKYCKPVDFSNRKLVFEDNFKNLDKWAVKDQEFYNNNPVWFDKKMVVINDQGLSIKCLKEVATHSDWTEEVRETKWITGMIETYDKFNMPYGLWIIDAKLGNSWPAFWLMKKDYDVPGFIKRQIIPEVDVVEVIRHKFRHTIHYGFMEADGYRKQEMGVNVCPWDNEFHQFAVDCKLDGYDFYIDGILTARLRSKDPEFVTNALHYMIINNASHPYNTEESELIVRSVKVYESEF